MLELKIYQALLLGLLAFAIGFFLKYRNLSTRKQLAIFALHLFIPVLISITILPIYYSSSLIAQKKEALPNDLGLHFVPFKEFFRLFKADKEVFFTNIVGNFLLLMPLAAILFLLNYRFWISLLIIIFTSFGIEMIQLMKNYLYQFRVNYVDVDDFILNIAGAIIVLILLHVIIKRKKV